MSSQGTNSSGKTQRQIWEEGHDPLPVVKSPKSQAEELLENVAQSSEAIGKIIVAGAQLGIGYMTIAMAPVTGPGASAALTYVTGGAGAIAAPVVTPAVTAATYAAGAAMVFEGTKSLSDGLALFSNGGKHDSSERTSLKRMAEQDKKRGITSDDMQAYKDLNKELPDPYPENMVRGPEKHVKGALALKNGMVMLGRLTIFQYWSRK